MSSTNDEYDQFCDGCKHLSSGHNGYGGTEYWCKLANKKVGEQDIGVTDPPMRCKFYDETEATVEDLKKAVHNYKYRLQERKKHDEKIDEILSENIELKKELESIKSVLSKMLKE